MQAIVDAIDILDEGDFSDSTGKPHVESIEAVLDAGLLAVEASREEVSASHLLSRDAGVVHLGEVPPRESLVGGPVLGDLGAHQVGEHHGFGRNGNTGNGGGCEE